MGNKWVFKVKHNPNGSISRFKARLVTKGFHQTLGIDFSGTFSPIVKAPTIRTVMSIAVCNGWEIKQIDMNNAFLNGDLNEDVFMSQPEGFQDMEHPHYVCKLNKALYDLKQAPHAWFDKLKSTLLDWGFTNTKSDTSLFVREQDGHLIYALVYVDDILITGSCSFIKPIDRLDIVFALKMLGQEHHFLGIEITQTSHGGQHLCQSKYI